jgi:predicted membrane protein
MDETQNGLDKRIVLGAVLIFLGGVFLLSSLNILDFHIGRVIFSWPFVMLVIGLFILVNTSKKLTGGLLTGLGVFFLIPRIYPPIEYDSGIVIPVLLILFGIYIIFKKRKSSFAESLGEGDEAMNKDKIDDVAILGGGTKLISSDNFKGGNITAIFGGSEINLMNCNLAPGDNVIDVLTIFGGTTIIVPKEWNIVVNVTSILGGFSNKSVRNPAVAIDHSRTLHIKGLAMFGGGEIKTYL